MILRARLPRWPGTRLPFVMDDGRPLERVVEIPTDVRVADVTVEVGARDEPCGLVASPAQDQTSAGLLHRGGELFKRAQTGGVQRRHVTEPQDDDLRKTVHMIVDDPE